MKKERRSPLKDEPLRVPGQSSDERRRELFGRMEEPLFLAAFLLIITGLEWWKHYTSQPHQPGIYTTFALFVALYAAYRVWRVWPELRQLRQARDGERVVGQYLEELRERGFRVLHDVMGDGFNVDHVLIGEAGVFTVETKTVSKPANGDAKVQFDGETVLINGFKPDRDPVTQARAQARWIRDLIAESTGRKIKVRPVVVYPGWWVECGGHQKGDVWVLNPKALPAFIAQEPACLKQEDVHLISFHLGRFVIAQQRAARR